MTKSKVDKRLPLANRFSVSPSVTDKAVELILEGLNTPRSLAVWLLYSNGEHKQLVDLKVDPHLYLSYDSFRADYLATELLSKSDFLKLDIDCAKVAIDGHHQNEARCKAYNAYFRNLLCHPQFKGDNVWMYNTFTRKIRDVLGRTPTFEEVFNDCQWGPGATTKISGVDTSFSNKFQHDAGITKDLLHTFSSDFMRCFPSWFLHIAVENDFEIFAGNRVTTVKKNAKTDRVIAIEPGLNQYVQKGIGRIIESRLFRSCGITLRDQTVNQEKARRALKDNCATIDMKSASSLISREMVRESLDPEWFELLDVSRSRYGELDGSVFRWENFSSMGNGFTFPFQSVIFYAAAYAACDLVGADSSFIGVYGDDVIIPVNAVPSFTQFLDFLGLLVNEKKSYSSSCFRESCGSHWFCGVDVKPFYLKERLTTLDTIFTLANNIKRCASRFDLTGCLDMRFRDAWSFLFNKVPKKLRFLVSDGYGDIGFISEWDEAKPSVVRANNFVEGYFCEVCTRVGRTREHFGFGHLLAKLSSATGDWTNNSVTLRRLTRIRIHRILIHRWRGLGVWVNS